MAVRMCPATLADDPAAERVDDEAHVRHPGPGGHVGQVHRPQLVGGDRGEATLDQVRWSGCLRVGAGRGDPPSAASPTDAQLAHQPGDLAAADVMTRSARGLPQLARPVDPVVAGLQRQQDRHHHRVAQRAR